jgi:hypothetical protein
LYRFIAGEIAVDALVFEFMGLAMVALCVIVLAVPSGPVPLLPAWRKILRSDANARLEFVPRPLTYQRFRQNAV